MLRAKLILIFTVFATLSSLAQTSQSLTSVNECYGKKYSVAVWVLSDTAGDYVVSQGIVQEAIDSLTAKFSPICVSFEMCQYTELPNQRQDTINLGIEDVEIATLYQRQNTINIYIVTEIRNPNPKPCGITSQGSITTMTDDVLRDAIFIKKSCFSPGSLAHMMGRFFGLLETEESGLFGAELVDGSNCATSGDTLCDTQADPGGSLAPNCSLANPESHSDANGDFYTPPICNIMSHYYAPCYQHYTPMQFNVMLSVMKTGRNYLW